MTVQAWSKSGTAKACEQCAAGRVQIGRNYTQMSVFSRLLGLVLIYLPILTMPFIIASGYMTYYSLVCCGARELKRWRDYIPDKASHRYSMKTQITMERSFLASPVQSRLFWILNCTLYCPYSVALFEWHAYLIKVVENWWCPFTHAKKEDYTAGSIDQSFWHVFPEDVDKLHEDDRANPIFTDEHDEVVDAPKSSIE